MLRKSHTQKLLEKENEKLQKENTSLKNRIAGIDHYKEQYQDLIQQVKNQRERYIKLNSKLEKLLDEASKTIK